MGRPSLLPPLHRRPPPALQQRLLLSADRPPAIAAAPVLPRAPPLSQVPSDPGKGTNVPPARADKALKPVAAPAAPKAKNPPRTPQTEPENELETAPVVAVVRRGGILAAVESRVAPDLRFPGDRAVAQRALLDWSRPVEHHSSENHSGREESEEDSGRATRAEGERRKEPERASAPVKEKAPEAAKAPEAKPQQPQRQLQRAITGVSGAAGGDKEAGGPSAAERAETVKKMSEQFQMSPSKPEMLRNAPLMTHLPGQTQAKEQAKSEMDVRQQNTPRETANQSDQSELRQSHSSQSSQGEGEGRGHQDKPGEEMQQRSDRGERHQRRRQNGQSGLELENEEEDALLEFED